VTDSGYNVRLDISGETVGVVPRTASSEIHRRKAYACRAGISA
jgi:hypothetical protein